MISRRSLFRRGAAGFIIGRPIRRKPGKGGSWWVDFCYRGRRFCSRVSTDTLRLMLDPASGMTILGAIHADGQPIPITLADGASFDFLVHTCSRVT
jgi:hypothetical protein